MVEVHFKNQFVAHRKIDVLHQAIIEMDRPESDVVDFRSGKNTIGKTAVNERNTNEITCRKITFIKNTSFKLIEVQVFPIVGNLAILLLEKVIGHCGKNTVFLIDFLKEISIGSRKFTTLKTAS